MNSTKINMIANFNITPIGDTLFKNVSDIGSFKMGFDNKKKEVYIDAKDSSIAEVVLVSLSVFFFFLFLLIIFLFSKNGKYFCKKKLNAWSYRSNIY